MTGERARERARERESKREREKKREYSEELLSQCSVEMLHTCHRNTVLDRAE